MSRIVTTRTRRYLWAPAFPFCIDYDRVPYLSVAFMPIEGGGIVLGQGSTVAISRRSSETYFTSALGPIGPVLRTVESAGVGGFWDTPSVLGLTPRDSTTGEAGIVFHGIRRSTGNNYNIWQVKDQDGFLYELKHHVSAASTKANSIFAYGAVGGYSNSAPWATDVWTHYQIWLDYNGTTWDTRPYENGELQTTDAADSQGLRTYTDTIADPSYQFFRFPQSYQRDTDFSFIAFAIGRASEDDRTALYENPYFWLYKLGRISTFLPPPAAGGTVTGTASPTDSPDTSSATGTVQGQITGTASPTDSPDTSSATGTVQGQITGTASPTDSPDTSSATGTVQGQVTGTASPTDAADTSIATGVVQLYVTGTAAATDGADTSSGTAVVGAAVTGSAAATDGADTSSGSGTVQGQITGTAAATDGADTSSGTGTATGNITGTVAVTDGVDTSSGTGTVTPQGVVTGSAAATDGADTSSGSGTVQGQITGTVAVTDGADTSSGTGTATGNITGTVVVTDGADVGAGAGIVAAPGTVIGTAAITDTGDVTFTTGFVPLKDLDVQSEQVQRMLNKSFLRELLTLKQNGLEIGTFNGMFLHTRAESWPVCYCARDDLVARLIDQGDTIVSEDFPDYIVEGVRSDGGYVLTLELRSHIEG